MAEKESKQKSETSNLQQIREMSLAELRELQARVEREIPAKARQAAREAAGEVRRIMRAFNVSWDTLVSELNRTSSSNAGKKKTTRKKRASKKKAGTKVAPKYRHPDNPDLTWAGRGRKPKWLEAELAAGKTLDDFKI